VKETCRRISVHCSSEFMAMSRFWVERSIGY
jgi:hypothetical protein